MDLPNIPIKNPHVVLRRKRAGIFIVIAVVWLVIGVMGYRQELFNRSLAEEAPNLSDPKHWADMPRLLVSDLDSPRWGMEFTPSLFPLDNIVHGGPGKDGVPALTQPHIIDAADFFIVNQESLVIGLDLNGQTRAYPLDILQYHEVVNDTLAGQPLLITFNQLSGLARVFSGRVDGRLLTFGSSGLFYQSSMLIYDRQTAPYEESLWSPMQMIAVCGPAAASRLRLEPFDADLMRWSAWSKLHPETTVLSMQTGFDKPYHRPSEARYLHNDFPMMPVPERSGRRPDLLNKELTLILQIGELVKAYPFSDIRSAHGEAIDDMLGRHRLRLSLDKASGQITVVAPDEPDLPIIRSYCYWFVWDAYYPEGKVYTGPGHRLIIQDSGQPLQ